MGYDLREMGEKTCKQMFIMKPCSRSYHFGDRNQRRG